MKTRTWGRVPAGTKRALIPVTVLSLVALFGPLLAPDSPDLPVGNTLASPSLSHLFGTDQVGRDLFSRCLYGLRTSWLSAFGVIVFSVTIGIIVGVLAGGLGKIADNVLMRITDVFLALPGPLLAIAVATALGPSLEHTLIAVTIVWWPYYARLIRGEIRTLSARSHVEAARMSGIGTTRILRRHLLRGATPVIVVAASLDIGNVVLTLAGLSFLGLGAPEPAPELGAMAAQGLEYLTTNWWVTVLPGVVVFVLALTCNIAGDAIRRQLADR
jgi:ABC-type dipeptide/oligopeptide/nickel transport system permease subunit